MRTLSTVVITLLWVGMVEAPSASARGAPARSSTKADTKADTYRSKTHYEFDDDTVEGDLARPGEEMIRSRVAARHRSLIRLRTDFVPELIQSADRF